MLSPHQVAGVRFKDVYEICRDMLRGMREYLSSITKTNAGYHVFYHMQNIIEPWETR